MSGLDLLSTDANSAAFRPGYVPTDIGDVTATSFQNIRQNYNTDSEMRLIGDPLYKRDSLIKERTGKDISEITGTNTKYTNPNPEGRISQLKEDHDLIDQYIISGRKENPSQWDGIKTTAELIEEGKKVATDATKTNEETSAKNPSTLSRITGNIVGGIGGAFTDPLNIASLPFGVGETKVIGSGGFAVAKAIAISAAKEGIIQGAIEAASTPQIAHWQNTLGNKYGIPEASADIALAAVGGAAIRGGIEGIGPAVRGVYKGTKNVSSYVLDRIEENAYVPQTVKDSLKYMSRTAYVDDAAPIHVKTAKDLNEHRTAAQKIVDDLNEYKRPSVDLSGVSKVITPRNEIELEVKSHVVDLADLITSDKPEFDQALQPRDRSNRIQSNIRINEIAARLDPAQLGDSRVSNTGAPIVGPDMMVESGNGRVMALRRAYEQNPDNAKAYRDFIEAQGFDTTGMKQPVLIRQRLSELTPEERKNFVVYSNEDVADRLSTTERAMADANLMPPNVIKAYEGGDVTLAKNAQFVRGFIDQAVSSSERNALITPSGDLSQEGVKRINSALLARAYSDAPIVQKIMEDPDNDIKTIGRVLMDVSGKWSNLRLDIQDGHIPEIYDITQDLMDAIRTIIHARQSNRPITDFTGQSALFADTQISDEANAILRGFYDDNGIKPLGYNKTKDFIEYYIGEVSKIQSGPGLFVQEPLTPFQIMNTYLERQGKSLTALSSSGRKGRLLNPISAETGLGDQVLPSQTSAIEPPSSFIRKRATVPSSNKTGLPLNTDVISISPLSKVYQEHNDLSTIKQLVEELKPDLENYLKYITDLVNDSHVYGVRVKDMESLKLKINRGKELNKISDYIGGRIVVDTPQAMDHVIANLKKTGDIMEIDDFLDVGKSGGYRAVHMQVKSDKGMSAEIQIQPAPIRAAQDEAHSIYKKWQNVSKSTMSPEETADFSKDIKHSEELFHDAWAKWENLKSDGKIFDDNSYRAREYRETPIVPPSEIKPSERLAANQARFSALVKENADMMVTTEGGQTVRLSEYASIIKDDEKIIQALTTCMVA